jgi:myo-inositol 2-dehydrogenase / D-chiro-inositol 1-dehydrogenase
MNEIRIGVLGFAHYHANFWSEVFRDSPDVAFAGVWDDDPKRGAESAARYGARFVPALDELLDAVDAVAVCSETVAHRPLIERAAARGKHVLCEKPIAGSREDARAIAAAIERSGVRFMQSFPKRFDPANHELRRRLEAGFFGTPWLARVRHGHRYGHDAAFTGGWWVDPARAGGGALLDEGVHGADFLRWLFGDPESVTAMVSDRASGLAVEDTALALFRFPSGLLGELATGMNFQAADVSIEIFGTRGSAVLSGVDLASKDLTASGFLRFYSADQPERTWEVSSIVPRFKTGGFHQQNALMFVDALKRGVAPPMGLEDGRRSLAMILAAYAAARTGTTQQVAEFY